MIQTNIKKLFESAGMEEVRPTAEALIEMGMSRRRFSLLLENTHATPITVQELEGIRGWIDRIKSIDSTQLVGDYTPDKELAESIGLSK